MNIHAQQGETVVYVGASDAQVNWGGCDDPRPLLTKGKEYVVDRTEVHSWHTKVVLQGINGRFPSAAFEDAPL